MSPTRTPDPATARPALLTPTEVDREIRRLGEQALARLDAEQLRYHRALATYVEALDHVQGAAEDLLDLDPSAFRADGGPFDSVRNDQMLRDLQDGAAALRRLAASEESLIECNLPFAVLALLDDDDQADLPLELLDVVAR